MSITKGYYGKNEEGKDVDIYCLTNSKGMKVEVITYGARVVKIYAPDKNGNFEDVVLGYDNIEDYLKDDSYFGAAVGRYANRIEKGQFELSGIKYQLNKNDGDNHLHGGLRGFNRVLWNAKISEKEGVEALKLTYTSVDGEENYPGNLDVTIYYILTKDNELKINYSAVSDKDTIINITNHSYFNLSGHNSGDILKHIIFINADKFTPINEQCLPTGEIRDVSDSVMDFRTPKYISEGINSSDEQIKLGGGYDHNFVLNEGGNLSIKAADVYDEVSGRIMEVYTNKPGMQLYTGNFLNGTKVGKGNSVYNKRNGVCFETQFFPNGLKYPHFPSAIFKAGDEYNYTTIYKFTTK